MRRGPTERALDRSARLRVTKQAVSARAGGRCEGCRGGDYGALAHLVGRRHLVRAEIADRPEVCALLCSPGCHEAVDQHKDPALRLRLHRRAYDLVTNSGWPVAEKAEVWLALQLLIEHGERNLALSG